VANEVPVEMQLLRDWKPRSRPSRGVLQIDGGETFTVLMPGADAVGMERMEVLVSGCVRTEPFWVVMRITLLIEGVVLTGARPGMMYLRETDVPSCVVNWPIVAPKTNRMYAGHHTLLMRTVES